eukprot:TRINITY_DN4097_c0_g1_i4.p1 TRINITY_DN4097_c0_g1~~TRINITY_DN4097_c0_g1_i4.p1  ORF type:complete len:326 (-),score=86.47 TRINITY_DN4097_c0_g1_i4:28-1005(-)
MASILDLLVVCMVMNNLTPSVGYPPRLDPPYDCGFEAVGTVAWMGKDVVGMKVGDVVGYTGINCFSEYAPVMYKQVFVIPAPVPPLPNIIPLLVSGLTASIALEQIGEMKQKDKEGASFKQERVLVTAAAGGTGQFAVQLAKLAGHFVIGTCGDESKVALLKRLGCDRVINYKTEKLHEVLRNEFPEGINLVYESVGGDTYEACLSNLAVRGRLVVIGMVGSYQDGSAFSRSGSGSQAPVGMKLLAKSASVRGFLLTQFQRHMRSHFQRLLALLQAGNLQTVVDKTQFMGLEQVADAVDYLYSAKNQGKVVVQLTKEARTLTSKL